MRQVLIQGGNAVVTEVPAPTVGKWNILVSVGYSCVSVGTEMASVRVSGLPLYKRALKQPENVRRVIKMVKDEGLRHTINRVAGKLAAGTPTGYSAAGTVIAVGSFSTANGEARVNVAAFDYRTGSLALGPSRLALGGSQGVGVRSLAVHGNNLYVAGTFESVNDVPRPTVAAIDLVAEGRALVVIREVGNRGEGGLQRRGRKAL